MIIHIFNLPDGQEIFMEIDSQLHWGLIERFKELKMFAPDVEIEEVEIESMI